MGDKVRAKSRGGGKGRTRGRTRIRARSWGKDKDRGKGRSRGWARTGAEAGPGIRTEMRTGECEQGGPGTEDGDRGQVEERGALRCRGPPDQLKRVALRGQSCTASLGIIATGNQTLCLPCTSGGNILHTRFALDCVKHAPVGDSVCCPAEACGLRHGRNSLLIDVEPADSDV